MEEPINFKNKDLAFSSCVQSSPPLFLTFEEASASSQEASTVVEEIFTWASQQLVDVEDMDQPILKKKEAGKNPTS